MEKYVRIKEQIEDYGYLTKGKLYKVISEDYQDDCGSIIDDEGDIIFLYYDECSHLGQGSWEVINEESK